MTKLHFGVNGVYAGCTLTLSSTQLFLRDAPGGKGCDILPRGATPGAASILHHPTVTSPRHHRGRRTKEMHREDQLG
ncbi:hypothetical protein [Pseudomonas sp. LFM046]|uniref:hypothetical protein n=1 Tax=Pseudomonas sp. LFM046 TaxID=1608357 RepID=UPI0011AEEC2A|nr:hypothetical protein [Pseudomonas sp. LFM046]